VVDGVEGAPGKSKRQEYGGRLFDESPFFCVLPWRRLVQGGETELYADGPFDTPHIVAAQDINPIGQSLLKRLIFPRPIVR